MKLLRKSGGSHFFDSLQPSLRGWLLSCEICAQTVHRQILIEAKSKPRAAAFKPVVWPAARLRCTSVFASGENLGAGRIHFA